MCGPGVVVFSYANWAARYPEFSSVSPATAQQYFNEAQLYCDNTPCSIVADSRPGGEREILLNMMTAHIAQLSQPVGGVAASGSSTPAAPSPLVGRISSATEGSVSVQTQMDLPPGSAQWFAQTQYGAAYWQATAKYRMMTYVPGRTPVSNPWASPLGRYRRR